MCAACVTQGIAYVGAAVGGLQVMAARARASRGGAAGRADDGGLGDDRLPVAQELRAN